MIFKEYGQLFIYYTVSYTVFIGTRKYYVNVIVIIGKSI